MMMDGMMTVDCVGADLLVCGNSPVGEVSRGVSRVESRESRVGDSGRRPVLAGVDERDERDEDGEDLLMMEGGCL